MKKLIIFDLDGTLMDTSPGILYSYSKAGENLRLTPKAVSEKSCVIGGPLRDGFNTLYHIENDEQLTEAINEYRRLYSSEGIKLYKLYEGISRLLSELKKAGLHTAVATLKLQNFADEMLKDAGLFPYFDVIKGWDMSDGCTKSVLLKRAMESLGAKPDESVLVGDSRYDLNGAMEAQIAFAGVSYGFGIKQSDSFPGMKYLAQSPEQLLEYLL